MRREDDPVGNGGKTAQGAEPALSKHVSTALGQTLRHIRCHLGPFGAIHGLSSRTTGRRSLSRPVLPIPSCPTVRYGRKGR